jgi:hypothetical protein
MSRFEIRSTPGAALRGPFQLTRPGATAAGGGTPAGGYELPRVRLLADGDGLRLPTVEVRVSGLDDGPLRGWLLNEWCRPVGAGGRAHPETPLTRQVRLPHELAASAAGREVAVTWIVTWGGGRTQETARLVIPVAAAGPAGAADPAGAGDPADQAIGFTVIDYGTTAITATMSYRDEVDLTTPLDAHQARVLAGRFAELLDGEAPADVEVDAWQATRERLSEELAPRWAHDDLAQVADRLREGSDDRQELLGALAAAVDGLTLQAATPSLRALARLRDDCYRAAFATPPRDRVGMFPVTFDADGVPFDTLLSAVHITDLADLRVSLWHRQAPPKDARVTVRGLKAEFRNLGDPPRLDTLAELAQLGDQARHIARYTTADLTERAFGALRDPLHAFAQRDSRIRRTIVDDRMRRLLQRRIVVTYPTMTPPDVRDHLTGVVARAFRDPETGRDADTGDSAFDEGVGAAFYFAMLAVGATEELGVEVLRAGSHPVRSAGGLPRWQRTILVIDIGGGTTDIALVALNLTELTSDDHGRRFELRPEVLGATGHPQLGGNYVTLRVLYWIKAMLADELLAWEAAKKRGPGAVDPGAPQEAGRRSLTARVLDQGVSKPVPAAVRRELDELVPTHGSRRGAVFAALWEKAEDAKMQLGARGRAEGRPYSIQNAQTLVDLPARFAGAPAIELRLSSADFAKVVRPVVDRAAQIAADLVVGVFNAERDGEDEPHLDQVALCGRTSGMPLVRQAIVDRLAATDLGERVPLVWNEDAVVVEQKAAKEAVSMGVAWAVGFGRGARFAAGRDDDVDQTPLRGGLQIETDVLFTRLPCSFDLIDALGGPDRMLRTGDPLIGGTPGVRPTARSRWVALREDVELGRPIDAAVPIQWARFRIKDYAAGHDVSGGVWTGRMRHRGPRVLMQVAVDDGLRASVALSVGRGHLKVAGTGLDVSAAFPSGRGGRGGAGAVGGEGAAAAWHWPIVAVPLGQDPADGRVVLPVPDDPAAAFPEVLVQTSPREPAEMPGRLLRGVLSRVPLPPLDGAPGWEIVSRPPDGRPEILGELAVPPGPAAPGAVYLVSLDSTGHARVHRGWPDYLEAKDLAEVERRPGTVLTVPMTPTVQDFDPDWYPFNGSH